MNTGGPSALKLEAVRKIYGSGDGAVTALDGVSLGIPRGSFTAVMGPSGSGKSTFLHCAAGLDKPSSGKVMLGDTELSRLGEKALTELRRTRIGFIFQAYNLLPSLNVLQNITLPMRLAGKKPDSRWLRHVVDSVGIAKKLEHRPSELSGGQQQRVAIARALITQPEVVLADEPTGALDTRTGEETITALLDAAAATGAAVVIVTHDPMIAKRAQRIVEIRDGLIAAGVPA